MNEIIYTSDGHNCYNCKHSKLPGYSKCINCYNIKTMQYEQWESDITDCVSTQEQKFDGSINVKISRMIDPGKGFGQNFWINDEITIDESELLKLGDRYFELKNAQIKEYNRRMNDNG